MQPTLSPLNPLRRAGLAALAVFFWTAVVLLVLACVVAPLFAAEAAPAPAPHADRITEIITSIATIVSLLVALWQNRKKSTAEKVRDTLILGIEHGTTLAEHTGNAEAIKQVVYVRAKLAGVEAVLAPRVETLTEFVGHEEHEQRVAIEAAINQPDSQPNATGADQP